VRRGSLAVAAALVVVAAACGNDGGESGAPDVAQADPARGQELFQSNCAACHGPMAEGTSAGPPLVHEIYEPGHHSDDAFQVAVAQGSPQHHWDFGPMPAVGGLDQEDVADITAWVRERQRDEGIID
jgi:mono/diheme cytochrome c family protein